jgi:MoxR-like ATPase
MSILQRMSVQPPHAQPLLTTDQVAALQKATTEVFVHHAVAQYAVDLVMATREPGQHGLGDLAGLLDFGVSPRATLGLVAAGRALALLRGRDYVLPADVADVAGDVLAHRLVLGFDAVADGVDPRGVVERIVATVPGPVVTPQQEDELADQLTGEEDVA